MVITLLVGLEQIHFTTPLTNFKNLKDVIFNFDFETICFFFFETIILEVILTTLPSSAPTNLDFFT